MLNEALQPAIAKRAIKMSLIVGTLLCAINHGDAVLAGTIETHRWIQIGLTYLVPYLVSTYSSIAAVRALTAPKSN